MIPPTKISLSDGIPKFWIWDRELLPHQYLKKVLVTWNWKLSRPSSEYFLLQIGRYRVKLAPYFFYVIFGEWLDWKKYYLPYSGVRNKTILDVGGGCGETALFYFLHGARRVICIEPDPVRADMIRANSEMNNWDMEVLEKHFETSMLDLDFDFMKMDCEGCESRLLKSASLPPCSIEAHNLNLAKDLAEKFGLRVSGNPTSNLRYCLNW